MLTISFQSISQMFQFMQFQSMQTFQQFIQTILLSFTQIINNERQFALISFFNVKTTIIIMKTKKHTRFLSFLINVDKTFKVFISIKKFNESKMFLKKSQTQTNQESDMNVMFIKLIRLFNLFTYLLSNIEFKELFMRIVNYRDIVFKY